MNYDLNLLAVASLVSLGGCVLQEPIGNTPEDGSSSTSVGDTTTSPSSSDDTGGSSSTSVDDTTTSPSSSDDTGGSSEGSTTGEGACGLEPQQNFTWQWDFGAHEPTFDPDAGGYDYDAPALIDCEPSAYVDDPDEDTLDLELACSVDGIPVEPQSLSLSPIPASVLDSLQQGEAISVAFRPQQRCPNGCFVSDTSGWLAFRDADDSLLLGIASVNRLLEPVEELQPFDVASGSSSCTPVEDAENCDEPGWTAPLQITVSDGEASAVIVGAGAAALGDYDVVVDVAVEGQFDGCTFDAGDRNQVALMILRR